MEPAATLRIRWLGTVGYEEAHALQRALVAHGTDDHLLLLEHPHTYTLGAHADRANVLVDPSTIGADLVDTDRGGDVTYHGPGQLVGYPVMWAPSRGRGGMADTVAHVRTIEQLLIDVLGDLGLDDVGRLRGHPGVWVAPDSSRPRKIAAIGVRITRRRTMHGFALNVAPDMGFFDHIVPCGIHGKGVTSLRDEGIDSTMAAVVSAVTARASRCWAPHDRVDVAGVAWRAEVGGMAEFTASEDPGAQPVALSTGQRRRLEEAGVTEGLPVRARKPPWMRVELDTGPDYLRLKRTARDLELTTVCEEAGCPNIFECWNDGTATFMINGERCTRACGFCQVDTRRPAEPDPAEPARVADAVARMGLDHAVVTTVARDDLADGGASAMAAVVSEIRARCPGTRVELLISDCRGEPASLARIFDAAPDVLNHNLETVARLQRAVRPSAGYARSLTVLGRAKDAGLLTKSSLIVGMGETHDEVIGAMADLAGIGVDIVTIGQYLRPTVRHVPVARWWEPAEFEELRRLGERELGIGHVEAGPLTRSSYHAKQAAEATPVSLGARSRDHSAGAPVRSGR